MKRRVYIVGLIVLIAVSVTLLGCSASPAVSPTVFEIATVAALGTSTITPLRTTVPPASTPVIITITRATNSAPGTLLPATSSTVPSPTPSVTPGSTIAAALKYRLIDQFGKPFFCDRDFYPVAHEVSDQEIAQRVALLKQNAPEYQAIVQRLGLTGVTNPSPAQNRLIDAERKQLDAIQVDTVGQPFSFSLRTNEGNQGFNIEGTISIDGAITVTQKQPAINGCPICLAGATLIDTPRGAIPIQDVRKGMLIWTADKAGVRRRGVVIETATRPVPVGVLLVHVALVDGRDLLVSAWHPTFQGEPIGDRRVGDALDGARIVKTELEPYSGGATYDLLASGPTGAYWANGILLGSTLVNPTAPR